MDVEREGGGVIKHAAEGKEAKGRGVGVSSRLLCFLH